MKKLLRIVLSFSFLLALANCQETNGGIGTSPSGPQAQVDDDPLVSSPADAGIDAEAR